MKLRRLTDYALRVLIYVAEHPGRRCSVPEVAAAHRISEHHLVKIVHQLGRLGYLETTRGRGGGIALPAGPETINLGEVVRRLEGDDCAVDCSTCVLAVRCALPGSLDRAADAFYAELGRQTLADIVPKPRSNGRETAEAPRRPRPRTPRASPATASRPRALTPG